MIFDGILTLNFLHQYWSLVLGKSKPPDIQRPNARMVQTQVTIAGVLGISLFLTFCVIRYKWPQLYSARATRTKNVPSLGRGMFRWIGVTAGLTENQIIEHAGLDAFVFLSFFKMAIQLLAACAFFGLFVVSPLRYHYTGGFDQGDGDRSKPDRDPEQYSGFLWMYVVFTYWFTILTVFFLYRATTHVLRVRQDVLGHQNAITDRTIRLSGIPSELRGEDVLARHIELMNIGQVSKVVMCKEWGPLNSLVHQRQRVLVALEKKWSQYLEPWDIRSQDYAFDRLDNGVFALERRERSPAEQARGSENRANLQTLNNSYLVDDDEETGLLDHSVDFSNSLHNIDDARSTISAGLIDLAQNQVDLKRPKMRIGWFGKKVDAIEHLTRQLSLIDEEIFKARERYYSNTPTAFVTMESVASAQMAAQAVLDPHPNYLTTKLAPAPHDIIWDNVCLSRRERLAKSYYITVLISIVSIALIFPVSSLAALLNIKTISKFFPELGEFLKNHASAKNFVTGLLPTYIFTFLNLIIPFLYVVLSSRQGFISHGEQEISIVSKNFFYLFVNMFLVFTLAGTASNYWSFLSDTTQIAKKLATSLKDLSLFYVDLIIFQGIGMLPFKLLLFGSMIKFPFFYSRCTTPREFSKLYKPPTFNFGLALPQPLLILIITIIYSVMSTKILISGLVYFIIGYYVYKYQLMYSMVHPSHSTGKVWPLIYRRVILGLLIFQLTMAGLLALQNGYVLALALTPLPFITFGFLYDFQQHYVPLSYFIALRAIKRVEISEDENSDLTLNPNFTLDEIREKNSTYEYPYLIQSLDGPWIAMDGNDIVVLNDNVTVRKPQKFFEWE